MAKHKTLKSKKTSKRSAPEKHFDKYEYYRKAVQSAESDVEFLQKSYKELKGKNAVVLREDFCGTAALSTEWVKLNPKHKAHGVDLDAEPMTYGMEHYISKLTVEQQKRIELTQQNVLQSGLPKADMVLAMNFSYFCFKSREMMKTYFQNVYNSLNKDGIFVCDLFGGSQCYDAITDKMNHKGFTYYWDQKGFDPLTNEAQFAIHFRVGGTKHEDVFTYDWRMWSFAELRDIMIEVGFKKTNNYWEGTAKDGGGNGKFTRTNEGESCLSWIAYLIAEK